MTNSYFTIQIVLLVSNIQHVPKDIPSGAGFHTGGSAGISPPPPPNLGNYSKYVINDSTI